MFGWNDWLYAQIDKIFVDPVKRGTPYRRRGPRAKQRVRCRYQANVHQLLRAVFPRPLTHGLGHTSSGNEEDAHLHRRGYGFSLKIPRGNALMHD